MSERNGSTSSNVRHNIAFSRASWLTRDIDTGIPPVCPSVCQSHCGAVSKLFLPLCGSFLNWIGTETAPLKLRPYAAIIIINIIIIMPRRGGHIAIMLSDVCLSDVCLSHTSGLSRERRGVYYNWHRSSPRHTDSDTTFNVKRSRSPGRFGWLYWLANMNIELVSDQSTCVCDVYRVTTCRPGRRHIVAAARLRLVIIIIISLLQTVSAYAKEEFERNNKKDKHQQRRNHTKSRFMKLSIWSWKTGSVRLLARHYH